MHAATGPARGAGRRASLVTDRAPLDGSTACSWRRPWRPSSERPPPPPPSHTHTPDSSSAPSLASACLQPSGQMNEDEELQRALAMSLAGGGGGGGAGGSAPSSGPGTGAFWSDAGGCAGGHPPACPPTCLRAGPGSMLSRAAGCALQSVRHAPSPASPPPPLAQPTSPRSSPSCPALLLALSDTPPAALRCAVLCCADMEEDETEQEEQVEEEEEEEEGAAGPGGSGGGAVAPARPAAEVQAEAAGRLPEEPGDGGGCRVGAWVVWGARGGCGGAAVGWWWWCVCVVVVVVVVGGRVLPVGPGPETFCFERHAGGCACLAAQRCAAPAVVSLLSSCPAALAPTPHPHVPTVQRCACLTGAARSAASRPPPPWPPSTISACRKARRQRAGGPSPSLRPSRVRARLGSCCCWCGARSSRALRARQQRPAVLSPPLADCCSPPCPHASPPSPRPVSPSPSTALQVPPHWTTSSRPLKQQACTEPCWFSSGRIELRARGGMQQSRRAAPRGSARHVRRGPQPAAIAGSPLPRGHVGLSCGAGAGSGSGGEPQTAPTAACPVLPNPACHPRLPPTLRPAVKLHSRMQLHRRTAGSHPLRCSS